MEVCCLLSNCFYSNDLARIMDRDVLRFLVQTVLYLAEDSPYVEQYLLPSFIDTFENLEDWHSVSKVEMTDRMLKEIRQELNSRTKIGIFDK